MKMWHCVNCGSLLFEAPTDKGHTDCGEHGKICFDCIDRMAFHVAKHRALEAAESPKPAHNISRDAIALLEEVYDAAVSFRFTNEKSVAWCALMDRAREFVKAQQHPC